jgi:hypothetical protein
MIVVACGRPRIRPNHPVARAVFHCNQHPARTYEKGRGFHRRATFLVFPPGPPAPVAPLPNSATNAIVRIVVEPIVTGLGGLPDRKHQNPQFAPLGHVPLRWMTSQRLALMPAEPHLLAQDPALTNARTEERSACSARRLATARSNPHTGSALASRSLTS